MNLHTGAIAGSSASMVNIARFNRLGRTSLEAT